MNDPASGSIRIGELHGALELLKLVGNLLKRVAPDLGECRVIPVDFKQIVDGCFYCHSDRHCVDEFAPVLSDAFSAQNNAGRFVSHHFYVAAFRLHQDRLTVVIERIIRAQIFDPSLLQRPLAEPDVADLRIGENNAQETVVIHGRCRTARCMPCGQFPCMIAT